MEQPSDRHLPWRHADRLRESAYRFCRPYIRVKVLTLVARVAPPKVILGVLLCSLDRAGQETAIKRRKWFFSLWSGPTG
jgi:hypothetical protein